MGEYLKKLIFEKKSEEKDDAPKLKDVVNNPLQQAILGEKLKERFEATYSGNPAHQDEQVAFQITELLRRFHKGEASARDLTILNDPTLRRSVAEESIRRAQEEEEKKERANQLRDGIRAEDIKAFGESHTEFAPYAGLLDDERMAEVLGEHLYNLMMKDDPDATDAWEALQRLGAARKELDNEEAHARVLVEKYRIDKDDYKALKAGHFTEKEYRELKEEREERAKELYEQYKSTRNWFVRMFSWTEIEAEKDADREMTAKMGAAGEKARSLARDRVYAQKGYLGQLWHKLTGGKSSGAEVRDIMSRIGNLEKSTAVTDFETYLPAFANVLGGIISKDEKLVSALGRESLDLGKVVVEKWDAPERKRSLSSKTEAEQKQRKTLNPKEYQQGYESWLRNPQTKRDLQARNITLNNLQPGQEDIVKDMYGEHFKTEQLGDVAERRRSMWDWFFEMLLNGFTSDMRSKLRIPANI